MNKAAIKNFAVWARRKLIADITYKIGTLGITESSIAEELPQSTTDLQFFDIGTKNYAEVSGSDIAKRNTLVDSIRRKEKDIGNYKEAFQYIVEEVAYTWFNRLIAIRFMEINEYLPSGIRVLSSDSRAKIEPDIVTTPFATDLEFTPYEQDRIIQLKEESKLDELFRMLFIKQCNKLSEILPELFEKTDDFTEILLTLSFIDKDGIIYKLTHDMDEDDFNMKKEGQIEIIGWMYQYYNMEPKAAVFAKAGGTKIKKEDIPAATQLFTPDWIVRYLVENSVGRIWMEGHQKDNLRSSWIYYMDEAQQEPAVFDQLKEIYSTYKAMIPEKIKVIDPCMGSGHILVYAFDVLMQIYESYGYTQRDAARSILLNNIFGLDIDKRAYQLAYFAVMMKARQYNRRILTEHLEPNLAFSQNAEMLEPSAMNRMGDYREQTLKLLEEFKYAAEYGSLLNVSLSISDLERMERQLEEVVKSKDYGNVMDILECDVLLSVLKPAMKQAKILVQKYEVVVTNPPYLSGSAVDTKLKEYIKNGYPISKTDLFAVFIERGKEMLAKNGLQAMITMHSWMFLSSYEKLREKMMESDLVNMVHLGARAFEEISGEVVQTTAFVIRKSRIEDYLGTYCRLVEPNSQSGKEERFLKGTSRYITNQRNFTKIPGAPIAYWVSETLISAFANNLFYDYTISDGQNKTGNNAKFVRFFWEVKNNCIGKGKKWLFYAKGGGYRKWVGNLINVVDWSLPAREFYKKDYVCRIIPEYLWYEKGITWGLITSNLPSFRILPEEATFDVGGSSVFLKDYENYNYFLGLLNSKVFLNIVKMLNPTLNFQVKDIRSMPIILKNESIVNTIVEENISYSKADWDSFETSWDFKKHPLLQYAAFTPQEIAIDKEKHISGMGLIRDAYELWEEKCEHRFNKLKANEEELNRIFIDIYSLQDELTPEVEDKDVTVRKADLQRDIKSLLSYAVGCMFGRYSLDNEGIAYAGGDWDSSKYQTFIPDADNCIPITDEEYFEDDIVGLLCGWLKKVYGEDTLEENLDFIANALGNKGNTSREMIRNYFLTDFIKDHIRIYQKRPIYWLFDSGKQNGFKVLCYMHRWNKDTIGHMRVEYLHRMQRIYEKEIERMQEIMDHSKDNKEISTATKRKEKLQRQLKETKAYDAKVAHLALARINIDLDDGVKVNYEKVQTTPNGQKMWILAKI